MKSIIRFLLIAPIFVAFAVSMIAQEVIIPDPGLNAAIRDALQKPNGPLTETDLLSLTFLGVGGRGISNVEGLEAARNLSILDLDNNSITNFPVANVLTNLTILDLFDNQFTSFVLTNTLPKLNILDLAFNSLAKCSLPTGLTNLDTLFLEGNVLTNFSLPAGLTKLTQLDLTDNQLISLNLPAGMTNLASIFLQQNQLTNLVLPSGLLNLVQLDLRTNNLTNLTLPPDMTNLITLVMDGNPLTQLVLSEPQAITLAATVAELQNQGIPVFKYPLTVQLTFPQQQPIGAFRFGITGPPGVYMVYSSTNLAVWEPLNSVDNPLGSIFFTDTEAHLSPRQFYRAVRQAPPTNMVFIPPTTFTMGSPTNDLDSSINERPQTTVLLTHGYWIGKYEVTQGEYLAVMNTNPSTFSGDLSRPVESVTWLDATNFCARLTELDLVAGRIPPGSHYRLPTEAEWECAARAGTRTRFSYGDDPNYASATNYAWFLDLAILDLTTHPVGQKLPNPWGLYDMHGNVWEWCEDNHGSLPGGVQIDPTGPDSTLLRDKVLRGGAYDYPNSSSRSASRIFVSRFGPIQMSVSAWSWPQTRNDFPVVSGYDERASGLLMGL
jgi:formylglycine-generating enzyme required for sulfatase activity